MALKTFEIKELDGHCLGLEHPRPQLLVDEALVNGAETALPEQVAGRVVVSDRPELADGEGADFGAHRSQ